MKSRFGLSDQTTQRLAEIRARSFSDDGDGSNLPEPLPHSTTETLPVVKTSSHPGRNPSSGVGSSGFSDRDASLDTRRTAYDKSFVTPSSRLFSTGGLGNSDNQTSFESRSTRSNASQDHPGMMPYIGSDYHGSAKDVQTTKALKNSSEENCVGFASLPDQIHRKAIKRGFDFTLMVVGESGLGKSTLISSMFFQPDLYKDRIVSESEDRLHKTVEIQKRCLEIEERGVKLRLTIVDTPGFGDNLDSKECWKPIEDYVHQQFDQYLRDETGLNRHAIQDNRVHCCLYFISPYGRGLRPIDVEFMKRLHNKVNIVPVIAKADTLTSAELKRLKAVILEEIQQNKIQLYELPPLDKDEDEEFIRKDRELRVCLAFKSDQFKCTGPRVNLEKDHWSEDAIPFAVIGGNTVVDVNGKRVKGRIYPWGIIEVENPSHSDVNLLRQFLVSTHMHDLKEVTKDVHYENFRALFIKKNKGLRNSVIDIENNNSDLASLNDETEKLLRQKEEEIQKMQQMLQAMQAQVNAKQTIED